jgi:hypothetical protein
MLPTCVVNFRCIVGVEHFQKILVLKKSPKHCQYFWFLLWLAMTILWSCMVDFSSWWSCPVYFSSMWLHYGRTRLLKAFFNCLYIFSSIPSFASNNHVLGWNSWPTSALLHRSVKRPSRALEQWSQINSSMSMDLHAFQYINGALISIDYNNVDMLKRTLTMEEDVSDILCQNKLSHLSTS